MEQEHKKQFIQAIASYLLNKNKTLSIKGPKEKVEKLATDLTYLKNLLVKTVPQEKEEGKKSPLEYMVAGIIGYMIGKDTGIKIKGDKKTTNEIVKAINSVKNDIVVKKFQTESEIEKN